jgi:hypothetical protein
MGLFHKIQKMLTELSDITTLKWIGVAFVIHVVVIGGFSAGYIRESLLGSPKPPEPVATPDGKDARTQPATRPGAAAVAGAGTAKVAAGNSGTGAAAVGQPKAPETDDAKLMREHKDAPVIKNVTEMPKPKEIPTLPTGSIPMDNEDANKAGKTKGQ